MENKTPEVPPQNTSELTPQATPPVAPAATNGLAVAGLVVGIVAFFSGWVPVFGLAVGIAAVILSILGIRKGGSQKGLAIAGLVTGGLGLLWALVIGTFFMIGVFAGLSSYNDTPSYDSQHNSSHSMAEMGNDEMGGYSFKVNQVTHDYKPQNASVDDSTEYVVVNLTVKNISNNSPTFQTFPLSLMADEKNAPLSYVEVDPSLVDAAIPKGQSFTGNLVFQVPKNAGMLMLDYTETIIDKNGNPTTKTDSLHVE